jgi:Tfp pilus assembly protein PilF
MKNYGAADRMYRKALKLNPKSALILKNYGTNLMTEHKYPKGWEEYQHALALDPSIFAEHDGPLVQNAAPANERGAMNYYMAVGCARAGYTDCALEYLRNALDEGYISPKKVAADQDFASLRDNPAFKQLLADQRRQ